MAATESSASVAHPSNRFTRGITLAQEHFEEITRVAPYIWSVPSESGPGVYAVNLKTSECTCPDRVPEGEADKHVVAARYVKAKTAPCAGCGQRVRFRDLLPAPEDHLTFYPEDELCRECATGHGGV